MTTRSAGLDSLASTDNAIVKCAAIIAGRIFGTPYTVLFVTSTVAFLMSFDNGCKHGLLAVDFAGDW
jgi:hypothetical protein